MKLTKTEKEATGNLVQGYISSMIISVLVQSGEEITPELVSGIGTVVGELDTTALQQAVAQSLLEQGIDLKLVAKVNKYLAQPDVQNVMVGVQNTALALTEQLEGVVTEILTKAAQEPVEA